jgi:hypothetical protein
MEVDVVFAILGGIIGATIGQFNGSIITGHLSKYFRKQYQRVCGISNNSGPTESISE